MKYLFIILFAFSLYPTQAQNIKVYEGVENFTVDQLGYLYIITKTGQLKKYTAEGDSVAVFNQMRRNGVLSHIDVSNPLKVLLYYKNFNTVVLLDRLLNVTVSLDLRKLGIYQVSAMGTSYDNNIWLYDEMNAELIKVDEAGNKMTSTYSLVDIISDLPKPTQLFDQQRIVYLYDPEKGVYQFDYFGGYKGLLKIQNWKDIFVWNDIFYGRKENEIMKYHLQTHEEESMPISKEWQAAKKIYFLPQYTYLLIQDQLQIIPTK